MHSNPKSPPTEVSKEPFVVDGLLHPDLIVVVSQRTVDCGCISGIVLSAKFQL